ncbi:LysR substrate-binding domain-containing protein [Rhodanobacter umsongensis]|uniref:LysR substrate-binding domain-containing protein n=1 Tax=Rhodanobacter umsongensis TaxID=633153 RepID=A0ABW0JJD1_9GAMM
MAIHSLPPLSSLRAFEAVARRSSFKAAAEELFVTPTAISHQIRQLEAHLGLRMLERSPRAVRLTAEGSVLYEATTSGFAEIAKAVAHLRLRQESAILTLSSTTAFLSHWLVPRLTELSRLLPDVDLRLHASDAIVELRSGGVDAAVRYGKGPFARVATVPLRDDVFGPVCSPMLGLSKLDDLRQATLIHIDGRQVPTPTPDWTRWCAEAGLLNVDTQTGVRFPDSALAVQAAIAGHGIAIVSLVLVSDALVAGLLVAPFAPVLRGETYHFACASDLETRPDIVALRAWLLSVMAKTAATCNGF